MDIGSKIWTILDKILNKIQDDNILIVREYTKENISINGSASVSPFNAENIKIDGYVPVGITGVIVGGNNYTAVVPQRWFINIDTNSLTVALRSVVSSTVVLGNVKICVLYRKQI